MLASAWFIARKHVQYMVRDRETMLWLFAMPIVFFYFIGTVTSGFGPRGPNKERLVVQAAEDVGFLADEIEKRLEKAGFEVVLAKTEEEFRAVPRRLAIPPNFTEDVRAGKKSVLHFSRGDSGLGQQYDEIRVQRAAYMVLADLLAATASGQEPAAESFEQIRAIPRSLTIEVQAGGKRREIPSGFQQAIPGTMVMFTLVVLLTSGTASLVIDRRQGRLRRLAATPISRGTIVFGKWLGRLGLAFVQIVFAMATGTLLFGMKWGPDLPMILLVLLGWAGLCASLALLLGNLVQTEGQAIGIGVLTSNALAALGGCWWPIEITPDWMQTVAKCLPTGWTMDAMHKLINFQAGAASAVPHTLALFAAALVLGWLAARRFRFQ